MWTDYLHSIAQAGQVVHIMRAAASSARIAKRQCEDNLARGNPGQSKTHGDACRADRDRCPQPLFPSTSR